jgi:hypothetical protein
MEVRVIYSKKQLEAAVKFIAKYNENFLGQTEYIRKHIVEHMRLVALEPAQWLAGTMGYVLWGDREDEGIDSDENSIRFDISVDPALAINAWNLDDMVENIVTDEENIT